MIDLNVLTFFYALQSVVLEWGRCEMGGQVIGECTDGSEVIPFLQNTIPDVILMDYQMPTLNGIETTKLVKDLFPEIKVIGLSNTDDLMTKELFFENGAYGFISKYEASIDQLVSEISGCHLTKMNR